MDTLSRTLKFRPHTSLQESIARPRLVEQCVEGAPCTAQLSLIVAPAGFGKTTLLGEIRQRLVASGSRTAWLNCDDRDRDQDAFLESISRALRTAEPGLRAPLRSPEDLREILEGLPLQIALFIDEYESAASERLDDALEVFARVAAANTRIFVAARSLSSRRFIALELDGYVRLVNANALRFSDSEASSFLAAHAPSDKVSAMVAQADGWPFVLQLLRLNAESRARKGERHLAPQVPRSRISDFLAAEVMSSLDEELRTFVIETSILKTVSVEDAQAVTGGTDCASLIRRLESLVPIVTFDEGQLAAQFHPLFQEYLRAQLQTRGQKAVTTLQERLARHLARTNRIFEAVRCAVESDLEDLAAAIVEDAGAIRFVTAQGVSQARRVLQLVPKSVVRRRLRLRLLEIGCLANHERGPDAAAELAEVERELGTGGRFEDQFDEAARIDLEAARSIVAYIEVEHSVRAPDWVALRDASVRARTLFRDDQRLWVAPMATEIQLLLRQGVLSNAETLIEDYIDLGEQDSQFRSALHAWIYRAVLDLARGDLDAAATVAGRVLTTCLNLDGHEESHEGQLGHALLGQVRFLRNDIRGAISHFDHLSASVSALSFEVYTAKYVWRALCDAAVGHLDLAIDRLESASSVARDRKLPHLALLASVVRSELLSGHEGLSVARPQSSTDEFMSLWQVSRLDDSVLWVTRVWAARALVATLLEQNRSADAVAVAQSLVELVVSTDRRLIKAGAWVLLARASLASGDRAEARSAIERALAITDGTGATRLFLDHGADIVTAVRECAESMQGCRAQWARQIVTRTSALELLTPRQKAVLRELAKGLSTKEIARTLTLSPETVKYHLKAIFERLGASNRDEAVRAARDAESVS